MPMTVIVRLMQNQLNEREKKDNATHTERTRNKIVRKEKTTILNALSISDELKYKAESTACEWSVNLLNQSGERASPLNI